MDYTPQGAQAVQLRVHERLHPYLVERNIVLDPEAMYSSTSLSLTAPEFFNQSLRWKHTRQNA
jgi:hypothetical protein